jgi:hypothetical protein
MYANVGRIGARRAVTLIVVNVEVRIGVRDIHPMSRRITGGKVRRCERASLGLVVRHPA